MPCLLECYTVLTKIEKNVYKNLTEMLMCFCCGDVVE